MRLPNHDRAIIDPQKLENYCLNPAHDKGKHKARVFRSVLGLRGSDWQLLRDIMSTSGAPMTAEIRLLDTVALIESLPQEGLARGQVGTVVETLAPGVFEVEFSDESGQAYAFASVPADK